MPPTLTDLQRSVEELNEQFGSYLTSLNAGAPSSTPPLPKQLDGPGDGSQLNSMIQKQIMDEEEMEALRGRLKGLNKRQLHLAFAKQAARQDTGVPLHQWLAAGGYSAQTRYVGDGTGMPGLQESLHPNVQKAADTTSAAALIRQDLEPILYELFVRTFPLFDRIPRIPSNGLVHAYNQMTSYGDADWIGELDTVTDDRGTYVRQITNIGILATRRGVSLKSQFAVLQGGAGFNPERLELQAGLRAMSSRYQKTILHGNWTDGAGTLNNEVGPFDDDSFDGFRKILNTANAVNVDPATNPDTTGSIRRAIDAAVLPITEAGGEPTAIFGAPAERITFDEQQEEKERIVLTSGGTDLTVGSRVSRVRTIAGDLPLFSVPGGANSSYVATSTYSGNTVRDLYVLTEDNIAVPYLGASGPTVLEIPIGVTGQLTHLFIIFFMGGLAVHAPTWNNKIRVKVA